VLTAEVRVRVHPADAVALALRAGAALEVAAAVLVGATVPADRVLDQHDSPHPVLRAADTVEQDVTLLQCLLEQAHPSTSTLTDQRRPATARDRPARETGGLS